MNSQRWPSQREGLRTQNSKPKREAKEMRGTKKQENESSGWYENKISVAFI
jgi:hypothetical protein